MKFTVLSMVKNEADIIESFVRHNLQFADELFILDNGSDDNTFLILQKLQEEGLPLHLSQDSTPGYQQQQLSARLLASAQEQSDADVFMLLDADEFICVHPDAAVYGQMEKYKEFFHTHLKQVKQQGVAALRWLNFLPINMGQSCDYINHFHEFSECNHPPLAHQKALYSREMLEKAQTIAGNHHLIKKQTHERIEQVVLQHIAIAHFPIRSREQAVTKVLVDAIALSSRSLGEGESFHVFQMQQEIMSKNYRISMEKCREIAESYGVPSSYTEGISLHQGQLNPNAIEHKYLHLNNVNLVRSLNRVAMQFAQNSKALQRQSETIQHELFSIKNLWILRLIKPLIKIEQAISSGNRYRKAFRLLVREKGSFGKAYQYLRKMRKNTPDGNKAVKKCLKFLANRSESSGEYLPVRFDVTDTVLYQNWIQINDTQNPDKLDQMQQESSGFEHKPLISILMPVYNLDVKWLRLAIDSVRKQVYENWELCISDDASPNPQIRPVLEHYMQLDKRIKVAFRDQNGHISENSNTALELASGEWLALMDHDDELPPHALYEVVKILQRQPDTTLIYTDEDKIDENGRRFMPHFKSDFNLDLLYGQNYISHLGVYRTEIAKEIGGFRKGLEGSQDYDFLLRYLAKVDHSKIVHIPKVLYHWRAIEGSTALAAGEKSYTTEADIKALRDYFTQLSTDVVVSRGKADNLYRIQWNMAREPLVSLIIPTRNGYDITKQAIDSILNKTSYSNFEILLVDNNSDDPKALAYFDELDKHEKITVLRYPHPFNYSAINNFAVQYARGEVIGLINNDVEVINEDWLTEMVSQAMRPDIGCVGAMLYYPNDTIQHAGVVIGINGVAGHSHKHYPKSHLGYFSRLFVAQDLLAVTAACLLLRKTTFDEVGGLNERDLTVAFNDVDLCLKVHKAGYRNLWTPYAELYHHESISRGREDNPEKIARFKREVDYMLNTWHTNTLFDPYYNPNLTIEREDFSISMLSRVDTSS